MRPFIIAACLTMPSLLLSDVRSEACINDSDTIRTEREYKKNYEFKSGSTEQHPSFEPSSASKVVEPSVTSWLRGSVNASGVVLMLSAVGFVSFNIRTSFRA